LSRLTNERNALIEKLAAYKVPATKLKKEKGKEALRNGIQN
jgi:hypothetical protein